VFRRLDDYERALELLEAGVRAGAGPDGRAGESEPARDELLV
jgi:hypothetical protein